MKVILRIPRALYTKILDDLARPHAFAAERVGFLFTHQSNAIDHQLVLAVDYAPVAESSYVPNDDPRIGVEIDSVCIRAVMQRCLDTREGAFHVHLHDHLGFPNFSRVDLRDLPLLAESFQRVGPNEVHGGIVLSQDSGAALAWLPRASVPTAVEKISVVGFPLSIFPNQSREQLGGGGHHARRAV